ncbi:hypothetical protein PC117_g19413 [Phytophthora cactorum]|uniref:Uncharacterized protein n=1 Tax=Phytophthora cactorum TaxID=29920 RepID=A0A8T1BXJ7_9STRA|nr:hypothetical protein PC117_g19413 [Phytophthora cactorum]
MELLAFSPSDDGEDMDVLEYEDADSELVDEDMRSTTASIENMEDDATVSVEDMDDAASSSAEGMSDTASSSVEDMDDADSAEEDIATRDDEDQDSDSSLEYESNGDEAGPLSITTVAVHEKMKYMSVGFYDTEEMAERNKTMVLPLAEQNLSAASVIKERTERFLKSLLEKLGPAQPIKDAEVTFLSLQQVTVDRRALAQMNPLIPRSKWRFDEIISIRKVFRCTCKFFMHTDWIPMRGLPGRPQTLQGGLMRDSDPYDVDRLIQLFTKTPRKTFKVACRAII